MADPGGRPAGVVAELHLELLAASFEERSPQDLLRWAIGCYGQELAIATSFQAEGMVLLDMAWRIDPGIRVITVDSGRLHQETYDLIDQVRERYQIPIEVYSPEAAELETLRRRARPQSLLPQSGAARPLLRDPQGLAADPGADRVRRLGLRPAAGPYDDPPRHPRRRTRQGSRRHREAQSPGELERRSGLGIPARSRRALQRALRPGIHQHRLRAVHPAHPTRRRSARRPLVVGGRSDQGVRHPLPYRLEAR